jgi:hypothetical protein
MPEVLPSLAAEHRTPDGHQGREVVDALTILTMKHPPQNRWRALQAETRAAEPNLGGSTPQGHKSRKF